MFIYGTVYAYELLNAIKVQRVPPTQCSTNNIHKFILISVVIYFRNYTYTEYSSSRGQRRGYSHSFHTSIGAFFICRGTRGIREYTKRYSFLHIIFIFILCYRKITKLL